MRDGDPRDVLDAIEVSSDAFGMVGPGQPQYEPNIDRTSAWRTQLQKACRFLEACRILRTHNGYYTSVIEMSFASIERTFEFYCLAHGGDSIDDFSDHEQVYDRIADLGLFSGDTAAGLRNLYRSNRTGQYYGTSVSTERQARAMYDLATLVHDETASRTRHAHVCRCPS